MSQPNKTPLPDAVRRRLSEWGKRGGRRRAEVLSASKRKQIAQMGAKARVDHIVKEAEKNH